MCVYYNVTVYNCIQYVNIMQQYINLAQCIYIAVVYPRGLINCDKYITLMQDVNKRNSMGRRTIWESVTTTDLASPSLCEIFKIYSLKDFF